jgi:opacity protein-like surface antigen
MRKQNALLAGLAMLLLATAASAADRRVQQTVNLNPNGRFSLVTHNGSVTVSTWNQPRVQIDAVIEPGPSGYDEDVAKVDIRISGSGSSVDVVTDFDRVGYHSTGWFLGTNRVLPYVHYTISLPATASVEIEDHNATVRVARLTGDLRVSAHNGRIEISEHAGATDITAHNADVRVEFARFAKEAEVETHNGAIELRLPSEARFNLDARGHHLGVDSDFPVVARQLDRNSYVGEINGGGTRLRISTHNGSVRLRRS